jgi:hypothetical protein
MMMDDGKCPLVMVGLRDGLWHWLYHISSIAKNI